MKTEHKKIYPYFIKNKIIGFLLFFSLAIMIYFLSIFYKNIPPFYSFIIICVLYAVRNYSNFIYTSYLCKVSNLQEKDLEEESKGFYFLGLLSLPIIFITGLLMNLLLQSPNYTAGFVQIFGLFSILIILNEFFVIYRISKVHKLAIKGEYAKIKDLTPISFIILLIIENVGAIFTLISIANKFDLPNNVFIFIFLTIFVAIMVYLFIRILKKQQI